MKRGSLNRDIVIEEALKMVGEAGFDQLTYNGLARALGVQPQSLYRYVANIAEVRSGVIAVYLTQLTESLYRELLPYSGKEALRHLADYFVAYTRTGIAFTDMVSGLVTYREEPEVLAARTRLHDLVMTIIKSMPSSQVTSEQNVTLFLNYILGTMTSLVVLQEDEQTAHQLFMANIDRILALIA